MKSSKKTIVAAMAGAALLLAQCAPKVASTVETTKTTTVTKSYTAAELQEGKTVFEGNCGKCHKLFQPETRTVAKWENIIPRMATKARLDDHQTSLVRAYILKGAKTE